MKSQQQITKTNYINKQLNNCHVILIYIYLDFLDKMFESLKTEEILKYIFAEQAVVVGRQFSPIAGRTQAKSMPFNISMMDRTRGGGDFNLHFILKFFL